MPAKQHESGNRCFFPVLFNAGMCPSADPQKAQRQVSASPFIWCLEKCINAIVIGIFSELQDPKEWIGRSFGYGQEIIDQDGEYVDGEINASYDEVYFTITGVDVNDNLILTKHHPIYGESYDSSTSPINLRKGINKGSWVWK